MKKTSLSWIKPCLVAVVLLFSSFQLVAQSTSGVVRCYTDEMDALLRAAHPEMGSQSDFEQWIQQEIQNQQISGKVIGGVYQIPVVFHVIHNGEAVGTASNVSYAAIQSQVDVLNEDFRKIFGTPGYNTNPVGADTEIEFCLAKRRPDGSAFPGGEDGVNRINRTLIGATAPPFTQAYVENTIKAYTYNNNTPTATRGWDPGKYMNIWLCDLGNGLLGYAQFPQSPIGGMGCGTPVMGTDGVVFLYSSIGKSSVTGFPGPYNEGRTATHEIGHWLGLRHIWGDGNCAATDYCNDTPPANAANNGCPTGINTCTAAPDQGPDMIENYMDYTFDACMNIFTQDQRQRMRAVLEGSPLRVSLINSDACTPPNSVDASITDVFAPTGDNCVGSITPSVQLKNRGSNNLTSATISYKIDNGTATTFAWTGNLSPNATATVALPAFTATLGTHNFKAYSTLPNGVVDPYTVYDTSAINFVVSNGITPNFTETFESGNFPTDPRWSIVNNNADCFKWSPASGVSSTGVLTNNMAQMPCYGNGSTSNDDLWTPIFLLPCNATAATLKFDVAYRRRLATSNDQLIVQISTDCGATWTNVYSKSGNVSPFLYQSTGLVGASDYFPAAAGDWRTETISLMPYVTTASDNIRFRFRGVSNNGNNIFVDNIKFEATTPGEIQLVQGTTEVLDGGSYNFPSTQVGSTSTQTFTINNTGTTNLVLTPPVTVTGTGFALGTTFGTTTVPAGGSTTFTLTFTPSAAGNFTGNVSFATNDCDEGTYNFVLSGDGTQTPPVADFSGTPTTVCQGGTVTFTNLSTNATSYSWNFGAGATPSTSTATSPTVVFNTAGTFPITLVATNSFGSDTETKTAYITVISSTATALPLTEGFTTATFPPTNWTLQNNNASPTSWARSATVGVAPTANNSMWFNNYAYNDADDDVMKIKPLIFTGYTSAQLQFSVAYAPYDASNFDGLEVLVSTNCGGSFTTVYSKSNTTLATAAATTAAFVPTAAQWRTETVDLSAYVGQPNVIIGFKNLSGYGNNIYVDNINITGVAGSAVASFTAAPATVCTGQTVTVTDASTNATSWSWNFGAGATPATATTVGPHSVTYSTAGPKTISLTVNGTASTTQSVTVVATPATPTITAGGPTTFCTGGSVVLTSSSATGNTWSTGATTQSITVSTAGSYTVSVSNGTCSTPSAATTVTVTPLNTVAAGINRTTCINTAITTITLATTGATGATVTGLPAGVTGTWAANVVTISGTPTAAGSFTYTVTTTGGCTPATTTGVITVTPLNTVAAGINRTTCINTAITTITLATTGATGATVTGLPAGVTGTWAANVVTISGTPTAAGSFTYTVTTTGGCTPATTTGVITVTPLNTVAAGINRTTCINTAITTITLATTGATGATVTGLPAGVTGTWAANVVTISGTPTAAGSFTYTVTTTGGCTPATTTGVITVTPLNTVAAGTNTTTCINTSITTITLATTGATGATVTGLPAGVTGTWAANVVTISGTPTAAGTFTYTVTTTGGCTPATTTGVITVTPLNTVAAGLNRTTCVNTAITTITLATTGATGATVTGLPAGVTGSWAANVVTISGTPTAAGTFTYTVTTTGGCTPATTTGVITVTPLNTVAAGINRTTCVNTAITTITLATTGATGATVTGLPAGVTGSWAANVVTISGTPTAAGTFTYTVTTTGGCTPATTTGVITVTPLNTVAAGTNTTTCINSAITAITLATTGATGATVTGLPAGVTGTWAANVVTISGTPTAAGTFTYTVTTTGGCTPATTTGVITVTPLNTVAAGLNRTTCVNTAITTITLATTGATGATVTGLPAGVTGTWAANVVTISGTPTAAGSFTYTVTTTGGCTPATTTGVITVNPLNTAVLSSAVGTNTQSVCLNTAITTITYTTTGATGATVTGLPAGVTGTWAANVVTISGTPSVSGTFNYTVTLSGGCGTVTATGSINVVLSNTNSLTSAVGSNAQTVCANTAITSITYATTGASGATVTGLPAGVTGTWAANVVTISGTPTATGTFSYTVTLTGGCGSSSATGSITVNPVPATPTISAGGATTFCTGGSVVLTSSSATGNTWSTGATTQSITVSTSGTYSVTVSNGTCSATSAPTTVTVNPVPAIPTISAGGATTFCAGGSVVLTSSSATGNTWSDGSTTQSITVNTSGTITVTVSNGTCSATSAPTTVTVNPLPATPTISAGGATTFCAGGSVVLTSSSATGNTWSTGATTQSITVSTSGTYSVTVSNGTCSATSAPTTVTVNPLPATPTISAGGPLTFCAGGSVVLTSSSASGNTWSDGSTTQSITVNTSGTMTVTVSDGTCSATSAPTTVTVNPLPATPIITAGGPTTFCAGGSVVLTSSSATGNTWSDGSTTQSITVNSSGTITVTVSDGTCSATSAPTTVTVNPLPATPIITAGGPTTFCAGGSVVLTSSSATGNTWSDGSTTQSITVSTSGTYSVTVSNGTCSATSAPTTVTVNPLPATPIITAGGPTTFCAGGSVVLTSSSATGNTWSDGSTTQAITVNTSGTITVTVSDGTCSATSAPTTVTVNPLPATPTISANGPLTFCTGGSVDLTSSSATGNTWSDGSTTQTITVNTSGTITVTVSDGTCSATSSPIVVTEVSNPSTPTISANGLTTFCAGGSVVLTSSSASGNTWSDGSTSQAITVSTAGTYTVTVGAVGCSATSTGTVVTVNPNPTVSFGAVADLCVYNNAVTLTTGSPVGGTYTGTGVTSGSFDPSVAGVGVTTLTYDFTDGNGCSGTATTTVNVDACASIEESSSTSWSMYPNPTATDVVVNWTGEATTLKVYDNMGKLIIEMKPTVGTTSMVVDLSKVANGVYTVQFEIDSKTTQQQMIVNR